MSDKLFERIATALEGLLAHVQSGAKAPAAGAAGAATPPKPTAPKAADKAPAAPPKPAAGAAKPGDKKGATPAAATKAPGGKYNSEQVRDAIRKVANDPNLGKQSARDVLTEDGGGAPTVSELKPEFFDAVYEACQVLLSNDGGGSSGGGDPDDPTA